MAGSLSIRVRELEMRMHSLFSDKENREYSRLCNNWRKSHLADETQRSKNHDVIRRKIRDILETNPQAILLHNQLALLEGPNGTNRKCPLPFFEVQGWEGGVENVDKTAESERPEDFVSVKSGQPGDMNVMGNENSAMADNTHVENCTVASRAARPGQAQTQFLHQTISHDAMAENSRITGGNSRLVEANLPHASVTAPSSQQAASQLPSSTANPKDPPTGHCAPFANVESIPKQYWNEDFSVYELPIQNPEAFPTYLIVNLQNATLTDMEEDCDEKGVPVGFSARLENHPRFDMIIVAQEVGPSILSAIGVTKHSLGRLALPKRSTRLNRQPLHLVRIEAMQVGSEVPRGSFPIAARLEVVRHPYLFWLEMKGVENAVDPPTNAECKTLAKMLGTPEFDLRKRIFSRWELEREEKRGAWHRANREEELGDKLRLSKRVEQAPQAQAQAQ